GGSEGIFRREEVWTANRDEVVAEKGADEVIEPVFIGPAIGVGEGDDFAGRGGNASITGDGKTQVLLVMEVANIGVGKGDLTGRISRAVVDQNDFVIGIVELLERIETGFQGAITIETGNDDRDFGIAGERKMRS